MKRNKEYFIPCNDCNPFTCKDATCELPRIVDQAKGNCNGSCPSTAEKVLYPCRNATCPRAGVIFDILNRN